MAMKKHSHRFHTPAAIAILLGFTLAMLAGGLSSAVRGADGDQGKPVADAKDADSGAKNVDKDKPGAGETTAVKLTSEAIKRYGVILGRAKKQKLVSHVVAPAQVSFNTTAMAVVGSPVQGRVAELKVAVGDNVKKGEELLVVESPELGEAQSDYLQKRTGVAAAEAAVEPAESAYDRAKSLYDRSQGIALTKVQKRQVDYSVAKNAALTAQAALKADESRLKLLGMNKEATGRLADSGEINPQYIVRAPLAGTVTERLVTLGELVKPDREKLLVVADMTTLWVIADVPEARVAEIKPGAKASVAVGDQSFDGAVLKIGLSVDPSTRSVAVQIEVKADPALKPGMFAQADIGTGAGDEPVVAVPSSAIQSVDGSTAVFLPVDGQPNTFVRRMVSVGDTASGMVSIVSGLDAGERIVTSGTFILKAELGKASAKDND
jgi:cobalt-zinc-cadmium efflux system membrane fusion protein